MGLDDSFVVRFGHPIGKPLDLSTRLHFSWTQGRCKALHARLDQCDDW